MGFIGPGDDAELSGHLDHSLAFATLLQAPPARAVDVGTGAGLPGLALALLWPTCTWTLLDSNTRRTTFLEWAITELRLASRVTTLTDRAEHAGRDPIHRGGADLVVARAFGPPAVTAECAAPLLKQGGMLVVADPPGGTPARWPAEGLALLGLTKQAATTTPVALQALRQITPCPPRYPRRTGIPTKRPLF